MPVFNIAANQIQASPIRSYYQGKALRADTALREKQAEALQMEMDSAPAAAAAAARKEGREMSKEARLQARADREAEEYWNTEAREQVEQIGEAGAAFTLALDDEADLAVASAKYKSDIASIVGEEQADVFWRENIDLNGDGIVGPEEQKLIRANATAIGKLQAAEQDKLVKRDFIGPDGVPTAGFANTTTGENIATPDTPIAPQAGQGDIGGLTASGLNKVTIDYRDKAQVAALTAATATEMVRVVNRSPAALAKSGAIIKFGNEIYSTAKNLIDVANQAQLPESETALQRKGAEAFNWTTFDKSIKKLDLLPEDAARLQAGLYSLAFSAAVGEQGSRPSDKDIQAYIKIYGGEITNASGFKGVIAQAMRRQRNGLYFMAEMNPEIINPDVQMKVFDREYAKFLDALDGVSEPTNSGFKIVGRRPVE